MKNVELQIDVSKINKDPERTTELSIDISDFDPSIAYIDLDEDLTEKLVSYIEKEVRMSYEYRDYINYLKNELDLTHCSMLPGIDCSNGAASLEFHHYPLNLYEITDAVGHKMIKDLGDNEKLSCFEIAEKVMEEHYLGNIGLVPLTKTLHDMAHNRSIIIPISKVNGNYKEFIKKYSDSIPQDIKDRVKEAEMNSESDDAKLYNQLKLEKNVVKYNIEYNRDNSTEGGDDEANW